MLGENEAFASQSSSTKLYQEDYAEVQALCAGGESESAVIRELVREGLRRKHYRRAASDPAIRELLRTFNEMINHNLSETEARVRAHVQAESATACNLLIRMLPEVIFSADAFRQFPADTAPDDLRQVALDRYEGIHRGAENEAQVFVNQALAARADRVAAIGLPNQDCPEQPSGSGS